jgi:ornithine decarboxylase
MPLQPWRTRSARADLVPQWTHCSYALPTTLAIGDHVDFLTAGSYTASYASVDFNGFPPLATHCI